MPSPTPTPAHRADVVDDYHGVKVADPYRWLETADAPDTVAWVDAENALTRSYVDGPAREALATRLTALFDYPRASAPVARRGRYFFARNSGLQNQAVLYVQDGPGGAPRPLIDPNTLSADGTTALTALVVNDAGTLAAYGLSERGSDLQDIRVREVATGQDRPDRIQWAKFASIAWTKDGSGFFYNRFPEPGTVPPGEENYRNRVYFHRAGRRAGEGPAGLRAARRPRDRLPALGQRRRAVAGDCRVQGRERPERDRAARPPDARRAAREAVHAASRRPTSSSPRTAAGCTSRPTRRRRAAA